MDIYKQGLQESRQNEKHLISREMKKKTPFRSVCFHLALVGAKRKENKSGVTFEILNNPYTVEAVPTGSCSNYGGCQMATGKHSLAKPGQPWVLPGRSGAHKPGGSCSSPSKMLTWAQGGFENYLVTNQNCSISIS